MSDISYSLHAVTAGSLGALPRILAETRETKTEILAEHRGERVYAARLNALSTVFGELTPYQQDLLGFQDPEEAILIRKVTLRGESSRRDYLYAETVIAADRLPKSFVGELNNSNEPIGRLWFKYKMKISKDFHPIQIVEASTAGLNFDPKDSAQFVFCSYVASRELEGISMPIMILYEYFPCRYAFEQKSPVAKPKPGACNL